MNYIPKIIYGDTPTTITLSKPPEGDPFNEKIVANNSKAVSATGVKQTSHNFFEERRKVNLTFLTQAETDLLRTFFENWAGLGKEFKYYESEDEAAFDTYTLENEEFSPKRLVSDGAGGFICELSLEFRRVF